MVQRVFVSDEIGNLDFPDDMDEPSMAEAIYNNFPELRPKTQEVQAEPAVSRTVMDPTAYWEREFGLDQANPPPPNVIARGGADAPIPEPDSDAQRNMDAIAVPEMFGMGPETPEPELPPDNGIGRLQTAGGQVVRGLGSIVPVA